MAPGAQPMIGGARGETVERLVRGVTPEEAAIVRGRVLKRRGLPVLLVWLGVGLVVARGSGPGGGEPDLLVRSLVLAAAGVSLLVAWEYLRIHAQRPLTRGAAEQRAQPGGSCPTCAESLTRRAVFCPTCRTLIRWPAIRLPRL